MEEVSRTSKEEEERVRIHTLPSIPCWLPLPSAHEHCTPSPSFSPEGLATIPHREPRQLVPQVSTPHSHLHTCCLPSPPWTFPAKSTSWNFLGKKFLGLWLEVQWKVIRTSVDAIKMTHVTVWHRKQDHVHSCLGNVLASNSTLACALELTCDLGSFHHQT